MTEARFAAIVLAAGASTRMGGPNKLLTLYRGFPLVSWAADAARNANVHERIIVTGRDGDDVARCGGGGLSRAHNARFQEGIASSLRLGLAAAHECDAVIVLMGNMPEVDAALIDLLVKAWTPTTFAVAPVSGDRIGHPLLLGAAAIAACAQLSGESGHEMLIEARLRDIVRVETPARGIFKAIAAPEDFDV